MLPDSSDGIPRGRLKRSPGAPGIDLSGCGRIQTGALDSPHHTAPFTLSAVLRARSTAMRPRSAGSSDDRSPAHPGASSSFYPQSLEGVSIESEELSPCAGLDSNHNRRDSNRSGGRIDRIREGVYREGLNLKSSPRGSMAVLSFSLSPGKKFRARSSPGVDTPIRWGAPRFGHFSTQRAHL
jgi:hypothetical protein